MTRTALLFVLAGLLGLVALVLTLTPILHPNPNPISQPTRPIDNPPPSQPQTAGDVLRLTAALSDPYLLGGGQREVYLKADIDAANVGATDRAPVNLALVLDRSGSMAGEKIEQCRKAARQLVQQLDERDRFALVTFGSDVNTLISSTQATAAAKERMLRAIDGIAELGGTNMSGGLEAGLTELVAYKRSFNASRIVLLSDGQANEGISDARGLSGLARRIAAQGITLSSIGVGLDFNEFVMESVADAGGGAYHFLSDVELLPALFAGELRQAVATVAIGPSLSIVPQNGATVAEVFGWTAETQGGMTAVRLPDFTSSQHRKVVIRMLVPAGTAGSMEVARVGLSYLDVTRNRAPGSAQVAVSASITNDYALATNNRNKDVAAVAAHADAVQSLRMAASYTQQGKRGEAEQQIRRAEVTLQKARASYGANKDFDDALNQAQQFEGALAAPGGDTNMPAKRLHSYSNEAR